MAPGLRALLRQLGLTLRSGGNGLKTPDDWISRIHSSSLALVVAVLISPEGRVIAQRRTVVGGEA